MKDQLIQIKQSALDALKNISTQAELEAFRVNFLGKKGKLTDILRGMGGLSAEERPIIGQLANEVRSFIEGEIDSLSVSLEKK